MGVLFKKRVENLCRIGTVRSTCVGGKLYTVYCKNFPSPLPWCGGKECVSKPFLHCLSSPPPSLSLSPFRQPFSSVFLASSLFLHPGKISYLVESPNSQTPFHSLSFSPHRTPPTHLPTYPPALSSSPPPKKMGLVRLLFVRICGIKDCLSDRCC